MSDLNTKPAFAVVSNSDLTEGRGYAIILAVCELETTALRLAHKKGVMGSDAYVEPCNLVYHGNRWYGPVTVESPTDDDSRQQKLLSAKREAEKKALAAGLSDADIKALRGA